MLQRLVKRNAVENNRIAIKAVHDIRIEGLVVFYSFCGKRLHRHLSQTMSVAQFKRAYTDLSYCSCNAVKETRS